MPKIIVYGNDLSAPARAVRMVADKLGVDVDLRRTHPLRGECNTPEYIKINPAHQIPSIVDGELTLSDSHAIVIYLMEKYGKDDSLYPKDILKRAIVNERLFFEVALYTKVLNFVIGPLERTHEPSEELKNLLVDGLETVERYLTASKFVAGDSLTIADYCYYCSIALIDFPTKGRIDFSKYKNIQRWMDLVHKTCPVFTKFDKIAQNGLKVYLEDGNY